MQKTNPIAIMSAMRFNERTRITPMQQTIAMAIIPPKGPGFPIVPAMGKKGFELPKKEKYCPMVTID